MELRRQAVFEVLTFRELNTAETRVIREQNSRCFAEQRAKPTAVESIQDREINATYQRTSRKRRALRFCGYRLASSKTFNDKSIVINCLQWKKYASFVKMLNGKIK